MGSFELIHSIATSNQISVKQYCSRDTGLTVFLAQVEGPVVNGFFSLATEALDDDGLPHTLEHLVFLGSEDYPYKGVLDLLANRCLASGTNAWTDTDHTCYTMETAGSDGFCTLMPIYLDHILYPLLTESGYITEVHHITSVGGDAGVVYCEMQGRENSAESRLALTMARAMYPGNCGYASETGGIMKNLRESTNNLKVKQFHQKFYRPENLKIIITGQIEPEAVFKSLLKLEEKIKLTKHSQEIFTRPWQSNVEPLINSKELVLCYPTDEEDNGIFSVGWRGPNASTEQYTFTAISILLKYLTEYSTYTLPQHFVEIDDPYASDISYNLIENSVSCISLTFEDVPLERMKAIRPKLHAVFKQILMMEDINMDRLHNVIQRSKLEHVSSLENSPHEAIAFMLIGHVLYGNTKSDMEERLNPIQDLTHLLTESKLFWLNLLSTYLVDARYIAIEAVPSKSEHTRLEQEERLRIKTQIDNLGQRGLSLKRAELEQALEFNGRPPPKNMLTSVPIPNIESFHFHNIVQFRSDLRPSDSGKIYINLQQMPIYTCFDHIKSEFVYANAFLDTSELSNEYRVYLPLILECIFESPMRNANGIIVSYEQIVEQLNADTISYGCNIGMSSELSKFKAGAYPQTLRICIQAQKTKYEACITWLRDVLYNTVFTVDRLRIIAAKMSNRVSQVKRNGRGMCVYAMKALRFVESSNALNVGVLKQQRFLVEVMAKLGDAQIADRCVDMCNMIWKQLTHPQCMLLHIFGNLHELEHAERILFKFLEPSGHRPYQQSHCITSDAMLLNTSQTAISGCVIGMGCLESSHFSQSIPSVASYDHPDLPALMLYLQYLVQCEGPMWRQIRGKGYAYGYSMTVRPHEGLVYLVLSRATNVVGAYIEARSIIEQHTADDQVWDTNLIDSARSSLIFQLVDEEKSIGHVVAISLQSYFHRVDYTYNRTLIRLVHQVTVDDLNYVGRKYVRPFLNAIHVKTAIVTVPSKLKEISEAFASFQINLKVYDTLEESFLNVA